jgi:RNA polymerase sigma-70 factor (ECF subfamily)
MLANEDWAHDATQEVFLRAYRSLNKFRGDASLRTWLYRIAINECLQQLRKPRREEPIDDESLMLQGWQGRAAPTPALDEALSQRALMDSVRDALKQLSPSHRAALTLRYFEEMSYEEIADAMNSSPQRVRALLHRAREAFRAAYLRLNGVME